MNILLIGSGGREHALAWAIAASPLTDRLVIAPGSDAMATLGVCVDVDIEDHDALLSLADDEGPDLVVIGPEGPLVGGLVDRLEAAGHRAFGPRKAAAALEGSKEFARQACARYNIPQPGFTACKDMTSVRAAVAAAGGACVIKADGLAAGKGVVVADTADEAIEAAEAMLGGRFGSAGSTVLVEERISGPEASLFALVDGPTALFIGSAQDHKRAFDNDQGPNTGGMGAISPAPRLDEALQQQVMDQIVQPLASGLAAEGTPYRGILYVGLMLAATSPQVIEFNCRFGDPEAQVILPRLRSDIVTAMLATVEGTLANLSLRWANTHAVTVVMATRGYPEQYGKGSAISGLAEAERAEGAILFHAGTKIGHDGQVTAHGGRVLAVTGLGDNPASARATAYEAVDCIDWPEGFFRTDIAAG
ncbi:MAG: phosphoribosylamine--glycine ligase [Alphaproteobacteria bacterium]|jgi:phosphoribosylamine--glycine ligase|nr:phosphoribosylamine--glycine ligase [Alphaproteobacteria bacterium]